MNVNGKIEKKDVSGENKETKVKSTKVSKIMASVDGESINPGLPKRKKIIFIDNDEEFYPIHLLCKKCKENEGKGYIELKINQSTIERWNRIQREYFEMQDEIEKEINKKF